jgi:hypothetical protein
MRKVCFNLESVKIVFFSQIYPDIVMPLFFQWMHRLAGLVRWWLTFGVRVPGSKFEVQGSKFKVQG